MALSIRMPKSLEANREVGITTNEASDLTGQIRTLKDKVERLMV